MERRTATTRELLIRQAERWNCQVNKPPIHILQNTATSTRNCAEPTPHASISGLMSIQVAQTIELQAATLNYRGMELHLLRGHVLQERFEVYVNYKKPKNELK